MNDELFDDLVASIEEGGEILRGDKRPSREYWVDRPDVAKIREYYGLSQTRFASMLGIPVGTLRNWEQGRRNPSGPARVLLQVAAAHPDAILDVVRQTA